MDIHLVRPNISSCVLIKPARTVSTQKSGKHSALMVEPGFFMNTTAQMTIAVALDSTCMASLRPFIQLLGDSTMLHLFFAVLKRTQSSELRQAIANVHNIGKAQQYVKLGNIYWEMGKGEDALAVYQQALNQEPENLEALWGSASVELKNKNLEQGIALLRRLIDIKDRLQIWRCLSRLRPSLV